MSPTLSTDPDFVGVAHSRYSQGGRINLQGVTPKILIEQAFVTWSGWDEDARQFALHGSIPTAGISSPRP